MRKHLCFLAGLLCIAACSFAQNVTLTGRVSDAKDGTPLSGVSVTSKQTKAGVKTDLLGSFTITVPSGSTTLIFSYVGFATQEVNAGRSTNLDVKLASADANLNEVVVVGYGTQQKKAFTGSASKVEVKEFTNLVSPSVDKQLAGRATGVQVTNAGGGINTPARIRIRGIQSINTNNDPLIVVDGIPIVSGDLAAVGHSNSLADINPSDIESLDVLKDGASTAIYGSRAAGGVILITTKRGTKGRARVNYETSLGYTSPLKKFDLLNAAEFELIANEKLTNAGQAKRAGTNPAVDTANTDWQSTVMNNRAFVQNHTLSFQGGNEKTTYYMSANFSYQKGNIVSNATRAYRVRMNVDHEVNKFVKIGNNVSISRQEDYGQNEGANSLGGSIASTLRLLPNVSPYNPANITGYNVTYPISNQMDKGPNSTTIDDNFSNVAYTLRKDKYYSDKYRIIDNGYIEVAPVKGLRLRSQFGIDALNDYSYQGLNPFHGDSYGKGENYNVAQNWLRLVWSNYINYNLSVGRHNFLLTAGNEVQKTTYKYFSADVVTISDPYFTGNNIISNTTGTGATQTAGGSYDNTGFNSVFGRFNYDFGNKYFAQATIRRDGQSSLAPGKKFGTFPGFSLGWRPSQEGFWQKNAFIAKWFNEVKFKASYAKVGNALGGYPYLSTFSAAPYGYLGGISPSGVGNPDVRWETSSKYDAGLELGIWNNRFNVTADYFVNDIDNLVLYVPQPLSAGLVGSFDLLGGTIPQNIGKLNNKGVELSISGAIIKTRSFSWNVTVNYSHVQNKITGLYSVGGNPVTGIASTYNITRVGDPINIIYGYRSAGVNAQNGNPMWYKADGTMVQYNLTSSLGTVGGFFVADPSKAALGAASSLASADKANLGQSVPTYYGAVINHFNYKGLDLEVMLRYSGGNKIMNYTRQEALFNMSFQNNGREILDRWTTPGQVTDVPKLYYGLAANMNSTSNASSRFVEDGKYLRLQNVVLSYALSQKMVDRIGHNYIKGAKVYVQGQNLHVWTKYKGSDPENISALGVDNAYAPQIRTVSAGLSVGF